MIHLIYISSATSWPTENNLKGLLEQARSRNLKQNITGLLLYNNATYMQVLEGSSEDVHKIYDSICKDSRNTGIIKLVEKEIIQRDFPAWSMGFKDLESSLPEEFPGFVDVFNGRLDKDLVVTNKSVAVNMLMGFAKNA
jgi:hypothetical protein